LSCLGFFRSDGTKVAVAPAPFDRKSDIAFVQFQSTVSPASSSPDLASIPAAKATLFLKLPQLSIPTKPMRAASADELHARQEAAAAATAAVGAMNRIIEASIAGFAIADLDMTDAIVIAALSTIVKNSTAAITTGLSTPSTSTTCQLFPIEIPRW
jgi:hypothetical protein